MAATGPIVAHPLRVCWLVRSGLTVIGDPAPARLYRRDCGNAERWPPQCKSFSQETEGRPGPRWTISIAAFSSVADCFEEKTEETTQNLESLRDYIDWEAMARDAELSGDVFAIRAGPEDVHLFWSR